MKWTFAIIISLCAACLGCSEEQGDRPDPVKGGGTSQPLLEVEPSLPRGNVSALSTAHDIISTEKKYGNRTLAEWQRDIKNLDPENRESYSAIPGLLELVQDPGLPWFTRKQAAVKLAQMGFPAGRAVPVLISLFRDEGEQNAATRLWVVKALAVFGPEAAAAAPHLAKLLHDPSQPLLQRQATIEALAVIGPSHPVAIPALIRILDDRSEESESALTDQQRHDVLTLRVMAADGLTVVGAQAFSSIPALIRTTRNNNERLRRKSTTALGAMGPQADIAIPALLERLVLDDSAAVRDAAADSLSKIGPEAVSPLRHFLKDPDPEVRWRALESLGEIGRVASPALESIQESLKDKSSLSRIHACEALWKISADPQQFLSTLIEELKNEDREIRLRAFRLLIAMGPKAQIAIEPLQQLQKDPRGYVRSLAGKALARIQADE